eukprot:865010-Amphidinium_carterae.1
MATGSVKCFKSVCHGFGVHGSFQSRSRNFLKALNLRCAPLYVSTESGRLEERARFPGYLGDRSGPFLLEVLLAVLLDGVKLVLVDGNQKIEDENAKHQRAKDLRQDQQHHELI